MVFRQLIFMVSLTVYWVTSEMNSNISHKKLALPTNNIGQDTSTSDESGTEEGNSFEMSKKEGAINSGEEGGDLYPQQHQSSFCCQCEKRRDLYVNSDVQGGYGYQCYFFTFVDGDSNLTG